MIIEFLKRNAIVLALTFVLFAGTNAFWYWQFHKNKVRYVRTGVILEQYKGMVEANKQFETDWKRALANADTLKARYESVKDNPKNFKSEKEYDYQLAQHEAELAQYRQNADAQLQQRKQELTSEVVGNINTFIKDYSADQRYPIVLGATNDGNILYGEDEEDITDDLLKELNLQYENNSTKK
ncbi:MAG: OmpH family outer membrane protein [Sporocytophaga sp.]|uniref:OmpH family outer membrane protein n=1 Tax=Sporocytophaga sp. TaxID=2231183 RepID=UPI001B1D0889|nr:OmpH family outer membrane protein [Sporocytophaga sp.]MBO9699065.1 OmpH family outer membrane protein [Sporocytophaga sp.]